MPGPIKADARVELTDDAVRRGPLPTSRAALEAAKKFIKEGGTLELFREIYILTQRAEAGDENAIEMLKNVRDLDQDNPAPLV